VTTAGTDAGTLEDIHSDNSVDTTQTSEIPVESDPAPAPLAAAVEPAAEAVTATQGGGPAPELNNNSVAEEPASPATIVVEPESAPANGFAGLGLSPELLRAVEEAGYTTPTPIQAEGIPHVLKRRDIIGIAQTGTGKTASFTLPMIEMLARGRAKARMPRSLILEPTRELAAQVAESFEKYGKFNKLSMALLIGGVSFEDQNKKLDRGVDVLIATPGRLLDHFERGRLMLSQVQVLVIDEADRMLDMGFIPDVERICKLLPFTRQTLFYSATMPTEIRRLTEQFLSNPVRVEVTRPATTAENIKQELVQVPNDDWAKREALRTLIREAGEITNAIVFCNKKHTVDIVAKSLSKHGFNAAPLHGDLDQSVRMKTLDDFRSGAVTILVASDVAARGLDIPAVSHVFNFDVPYHSDDYVHRIGRTGRAGRSGFAYMLVSSADSKYVEAIEKLTKMTLSRRTIEGLAEQVRERPPRDKFRNNRDGGGRGRDRDRQGRKDHRDHPIKPHGQVAAMEPAKPVSPPAPRNDQPRQDQRYEQRQEQRHEQRPRSDHRQDFRQQQRRPERAPEPVNRPEPVHYAQVFKQKNNAPKVEVTPVDISQLPAFLLRPVKLPKTPEKPEKPEKPVKKAVAKKPVEKAAAPKPVAKPVEPVAAIEVQVAPVAAETAPVMPIAEAPAVVETPVVAAPVADLPVEAVVTEAAAADAVPAEAPVAEKPKRKRAPRKKPVKAAEPDAV
jgi:superfamily II DNA/RNA helicase